MTYTLSDLLMFEPAVYFRLFELYNHALWPVGHLLAAGAAVLLLVVLRRDHGRLVAGLLAVIWAWVAWGFLQDYYASINLAAPWFAIAFGLQAVLLAGLGMLGPGLRFAWRWDGVAVFLVVLLLQPLAGPLAGRAWSGVELFGLAPDPTAAGTLGLLVLAEGRRRWLLAVLPVLWTVVTGLTHWTMGTPHGLLTPAAALVALVFMRRSGPWRKPPVRPA